MPTIIQDKFIIHPRTWLLFRHELGDFNQLIIPWLVSFFGHKRKGLRCSRSPRYPGLRCGVLRFELTASLLLQWWACAFCPEFNRCPVHIVNRPSSCVLPRKQPTDLKLGKDVRKIHALNIGLTSALDGKHDSCLPLDLFSQISLWHFFN